MFTGFLLFGPFLRLLFLLHTGNRDILVVFASSGIDFKRTFKEIIYVVAAFALDIADQHVEVPWLAVHA